MNSAIDEALFMQKKRSMQRTWDNVLRIMKG